MTSETLTYPPLTEHRQYARLPSHCGCASFQIGDTAYSGSAEFLLPAEGQAIVAFHSTADQTSQGFGSDLVIEGSSEFGLFRIECARCYVRHQIKSPSGSGGWSLISPVNAPARVRYGDTRPVSRATVVLNNFDYACGDAVRNDKGFTRMGTPLSIDLGNRRIIFRHHRDWEQLQPLVSAGILDAASLTEVTFDLAPEESDDQVLEFAVDVAALCTFASGSSASVAMLDLLDGDGAIVRRVIPQPVASRYRRNDIIEDFELSAFFRQAFGEYVKMKRTHAPWRKLASYCGALEDAPYLEQKFASLIMALEFFMRNCLAEQGQPEQWLEKRDFLELVGAARKHLGWQVPKHYVARQTVRLLRNAVMHGGELPTRDSAEFRLLFDKWRLFLFRRVLMRLGYAGRVVSPHKGWISSSDVADFTGEHNSFTPADPDALDSWTQFVKRLKERDAGAAGTQV